MSGKRRRIAETRGREWRRRAEKSGIGVHRGGIKKREGKLGTTESRVARKRLAEERHKRMGNGTEEREDKTASRVESNNGMKCDKCKR